MSKGITFLKSYLRTRYFATFKDRDTLIAWQSKKLTNHLQWVKKNSPYYRSKPQARPRDLTSWPMMNKTTMMNNFDQIITTGMKLDGLMNEAMLAEKSRDFTSRHPDYTVGLSSGTSGNRGLFLASDKEQAEWAGSILARALPRSLLSPCRIALFLRANNNLYERCGTKHITFQFFDLIQPLPSHLDRLKIFDPTVIVAPPSLLKQLSLSGAASQLHPKKIYAVAETLEDKDRELIERTFKQKLHIIYQATEGFLAITCPHGNLHLNEDILHFELQPIDNDPHRVTPIITDFRRKSQPIIRYHLDDILHLNSEPCPCGSIFTRIKRIEGRCDDIVYLPSATHPTKEVIVFPDFLTRAVIMADAQIDHYKIIQNRDASLTIELYEWLDQAITQQVKTNLLLLSKKLQITPPKITFSNYTPPANTEKRRRVISLYTRENHE